MRALLLLAVLFIRQGVSPAPQRNALNDEPLTLQSQDLPPYEAVAHLGIMVNEIGDSQRIGTVSVRSDNCTDIDSHADHPGMVAGCCRGCRAESPATSNESKQISWAELSERSDDTLVGGYFRCERLHQ
jgi:hypothetical protein